MGQCAGDIALADAGGTRNEAVVMLANPTATGERQHGGLVEVPGVAVVDVFNGGRQAQLSLAQADLQSVAVAFSHFPIHEQSEPVFKRKPLVAVLVSLFFERFGHAGQAQLLQFVNGRLVQHVSPSFRPQR